MVSPTNLAGLDANVAVYATDPAAAQHTASARLVYAAAGLPQPLVVLPQTCSEFLSTVTGKRVPTRRTLPEALDLLDGILAQPHVALLPDPADLTARFVTLLRAHPAAGPKVYDRRLAAALLSHGVGTLYTFNTADFAGVGVVAVEPAP